MDRTVREFLKVYGREELEAMTAATAGLRYYRLCTEELNDMPLDRDRFRASMAEAGIQFRELGEA